MRKLVESSKTIESENFNNSSIPDILRDFIKIVNHKFRDSFDSLWSYQIYGIIHYDLIIFKISFFNDINYEFKAPINSILKDINKLGIDSAACKYAAYMIRQIIKEIK